MLSGHTDNFKFLAEAARGLLSACRIPRLPDPLGQRHVTRPRNTLDVSMFRLFQDYPQSFRHGMSLSDSLL